MITRKVTDIWFVGHNPSTLSVRIKYKWWKVSWTIIKTTMVKSEITMEQINIEVAKLMEE